MIHVIVFDSLYFLKLLQWSCISSEVCLFPCFLSVCHVKISIRTITGQTKSTSATYACLLSNITQNDLRNSVRVELGAWREKKWVPYFNTSPKYDQWLQKTDLCFLLEHFKCTCDNCKGCHWTSYFLCL